MKKKGEDSDNDDFELRKDDNLLVSGHFDEDICSLNIYGKFLILNNIVGSYVNPIYSNVYIGVFLN